MANYGVFPARDAISFRETKRRLMKADGFVEHQNEGFLLRRFNSKRYNFNAT